MKNKTNSEESKPEISNKNLNYIGVLEPKTELEIEVEISGLEALKAEIEFKIKGLRQSVLIYKMMEEKWFMFMQRKNLP